MNNLETIINSREAIKRIKASAKEDFAFQISVDTYGLPDCYDQTGEHSYSCNPFGFKVGQVLSKRAKELNARHKRFSYYMRETRHNWQDGDKVHYADNSIEVKQVSLLTGASRQVMVKSPSGDACF